MPDAETLQQIATVQTQVKKLQTSRDQLIRDTGVAERKLEESLEKLKELGIDAAGLTSKELQDMAVELETTLKSKLTELSTQVTNSEALVAKANALRGA